MQFHSVKIPKLKFSVWYSWGERTNIPGNKWPGVYLIAISHKNLSGSSFRWKDVSYIGMTNSKLGLNGRWRQFNNSIHGKDGHSGGNAVFKDLRDYRNWTKKLYVAAMPIECDVGSPRPQEVVKKGWVAYLEYEAFAKFSNANNKNKKPKYNTR